ncbi:outer membrane protein assembly factor BamA [Thermodesulfovibrio sp. 3907-1M]|uniref:Outer membrane protein assembly factor BamA n=1 Tax=Thermodesulfovibrio autotrophicus TaxID=3118333 RepID=A0AAU8GXE3_9BACT
MRLSFALSFVSIFITLFNFAYAEEYIKKIEIEGLKYFPEKEFIYLIGVRENQAFIPQEITEGIKRAFLKNSFDDIVVEYKEGIMKISVKEKPLINKIEIKGNEYFTEKFFKKLLSFKKGDRLKEIELKKTQHNIENELNKRGFINCKVNIEKKVSENFADITIYINEGEPLKIKNIKWEGIFDEYIKNFLSLNAGEPFDKVMLEEFINKAKKYFIKHGLIGSEISYSFKNGELTLTIKEGRKLQLAFKGVNSLSERDLKNIVMAHFQDQVNENIIKDSINSLITFYRANGFLEVKVVSLLEQSKDEWKITYFINEGDRKFVKKIEIQTKLPREEIEKLLANKEGSPFNPEELENDRQRIEEYFKIKGYFNCKVFPPQLQEEDNSVSILFKVQEGEQVKIKNIEIKVKDNLLKAEAEEVAKTYINSPFNETTFLEMKRKIREIYLKNGYSEARIEGNYEIKNSDAYVSLKIEPGSKKYFGKSIILGNEKTKTKFIYQRLLPKEGQPYNPYTLEEERQILYKTGLFSRIDIKPQSMDSSLDLIYNFEEAPAGAFEFGFGYGEYEKAKGFAELSYINLFGMNKQIFSRVEISSLERRSYITYIDPWILKDLTFKSSLLFERMDFKNIDTKDIIYKLKRYGVSAGFEKKFFESFKAELLYEATYSKTWDVMPEVVISDQDIGELFISGIKASLIYDSRDNPFDPTKGWLAGVTSKLSSEFLGSEINFMKSSFYINKYTELTKGFVLATSLRGGWAWLYRGTDNLPISERYFLGGRDTVRGYAQNTLGPKQDNQPTGGNAFLMGNIEFRTYLGKNFSIVNFLDFGNVWKRVGDVDVSNLKYTTGAGLRYKTPVGPLRIDYGYKLNRKAGESHGEIHFSIGHAF